MTQIWNGGLQNHHQTLITLLANLSLYQLMQTSLILKPDELDAHLPLYTGFLFSANAAKPSRRSSVGITYSHTFSDNLIRLVSMQHWQAPARSKLLQTQIQMLCNGTPSVRATIELMHRWGWWWHLSTSMPRLIANLASCTAIGPCRLQQSAAIQALCIYISGAIWR